MKNNSNGWSVLIAPDFGFFIIFMILKLVGAINWPWWLVCFPLWGPLALLIILIITSILILGITSFCM